MKTPSARFQGTLAALLVTPLLACIAPVGDGNEGSAESTGEVSSAIICSIQHPTPGCTGGGGGGQNLPWASYVQTATTDLTATITFLTQRGPAATTISLTSAMPASPLPAPVSDAGGTSHALGFTGLLPQTTYGFAITVAGVSAYTGTFTTLAAPAIGLSGPSIVRAIEQATSVNFPVTITGTDHAVHGILQLNTVNAPSYTISSPAIPVNVPAYGSVPVAIPVSLPNAVALADNTSATLGEFDITATFTYEQYAPTVTTLLRTYPESLPLSVNVLAANSMEYDSASCAALAATGLVILWPDGDVDLQFAWNASSYSDNAGNAVLFAMSWRNRPLLEGVYVETQQSQVYFQASPRFLSNYVAPDYVAVQDDMWAHEDSVVFTCQSVGAGTTL